MPKETELQRRISRIDRLQRELGDEVARLRELVGAEETDEERWARMMLSVLGEIDRRGGSVSMEELRDVGERYGYNRRGLAGFYQSLVSHDGAMATLTPEGTSRLEALRRRYKELP